MRVPGPDLVHNYGEGTGWMQNPKFSPVNDWMINDVWHDLTDQATQACTCRR
jgi:hypothetical protein